MIIEDPKAIEALCLFYKDKHERAERLIAELKQEIKREHDMFVGADQMNNHLIDVNKNQSKELVNLQIENDDLRKRFLCDDAIDLERRVLVLLKIIGKPGSVYQQWEVEREAKYILELKGITT